MKNVSRSTTNGKLTLTYIKGRLFPWQSPSWDIVLTYDDKSIIIDMHCSEFNRELGQEEKITMSGADGRTYKGIVIETHQTKEKIEIIIKDIKVIVKADVV